MDAAQAGLLVALAGRPARLVVGDDQLAVVVQLQTVDDAPQAQAAGGVALGSARRRADVDLHAQLGPHDPDPVGVLQDEVVAAPAGGRRRRTARGRHRPGQRRALRAGAGALRGPGPVSRRRPSGVRSPCCSSHISSSRARCTTVPLKACRLVGSGTLSMADRRNARAHSLNVETFEGVSEAGNCNAIGDQANQPLGPGTWTRLDRVPPLVAGVRLRRRAPSGGHRPSWLCRRRWRPGLERPEVPQQGHHFASPAASWAAIASSSAGGTAGLFAPPSTATGQRTAGRRSHEPSSAAAA